ncbi:MAG: c-type cytochrome domain-containing protein, partial [Bacteroidota bacterium]|nr:c-type cytochrome domain-containing protein [Bacteroidota bacterium]
MNTIPKEMVNEISKLPDKIDYNYHVKPILSDKCFVCHGPDAKNRKANLRLDFNEKFLKETDPQFQTLDDVKTEIPNRLLSQDPDTRMPPPESHLKLSDQEIATILKWMEQGGEYKPHWSLISLSKYPLPKTMEDGWIENEIDY